MPGDDGLSDFEAFVHENEAAIVAMAYIATGSPEDAHDLAQEAFARAWQNWERLQRHENPPAWIRLVLHNLATSRWRRLRLERHHKLQAGRAVVTAAAGPDAAHLDLVRSIDRLPAKHRRALVLHDVVGLSVDEVATEMKVPPGTVRSWLHRARATLAADLGSSPVGDPAGKPAGDPAGDGDDGKPAAARTTGGPNARHG